MKTYTARMAVLAVLTAFTMVGSAFAGQTQAEREASREKVAGKAKIGAPIPVFDSDSWEYRAAMETGNLPSGAGALTLAAGSAGKFTTVEISGLDYRIGIDTP
jgi:hypothetical protein